MKVAVLGAGSWGTTIASLLAPRSATTIWARTAAVADELRKKRTNTAYLGPFEIPPKLLATSSLAEALESAELVVLAIPSHGLRQVLVEAAPFVVRHPTVLSLTKGLEEHTRARMSEVVSECWPGSPVGVLTGPNLAQEVCAGQPTASVIAYANEELAGEVRELFATEILRIYTNPDVIGCEIAGVVKNVMAIASGMAIGLGLGDNTRAALITRSLAELTRLGVALGGEPPTFAGLAGLGDLVATCTSAKSRNFSVGVALGQGKTLAEAIGATRMVAEGVKSCQPVLELATSLGVEVPVAEQVVAVCHANRSPKEAIPILMRRAPKSEVDPLVFGDDR
ncbi:MAG: NAD(P)H-dependent glycerol-3-phosphate dehydrogenase [Acidimicrobiales bacterium]